MSDGESSGVQIYYLIYGQKNRSSPPLFERYNKLQEELEHIEDLSFL